MQWGVYQDFGTENFSGMPFGPSAFDPYWPCGMPMGMDGYMAPFGGGMPYMGYPPGPFDVPYGGMLSQYPFVQQGYNMMHPGIPQRDLSEFGTGNMGINQGRPVMSREEFEARKADVRKEREMERLSERDHSRDRGDRGREMDRGDRGREMDRGDRGREVGSSLDVSPMKAKPGYVMDQEPIAEFEKMMKSKPNAYDENIEQSPLQHSNIRDIMDINEIMRVIKLQQMNIKRYFVINPLPVRCTRRRGTSIPDLRANCTLNVKRQLKRSVNSSD